MSNVEWLPDAYKAPGFDKSPEPDKVVKMSDNLPRAATLSGLGSAEFFIDKDTLNNALKETSLCQKYFQAAASQGFRTYTSYGIVDGGKFTGIAVKLSK